MKKTFLFNLLLLCSVCAQDLHELSVYGGGGLSTLMYNPTLGKQSNGFDTQFGFGYAFFITRNFGFLTGVDAAFYNASFKLNNLKMQSNAKDIEEGVDFVFNSALNNYKENQSASVLQIPLMLQFQTTGKYKYYATVGVKAAIPISGSRSGSGKVVNSGYYEEENYEYTEQKFRGFGTFENKKIEGKESFKNSFLASMEMGMKWRFNYGFSIYTGAYFDYGLGNILKKQDAEKLSEMVEYNSQDPQNFIMNGVLNSQWKNNDSPQAFVTKITPMAIGVKIKLALGRGVDYHVKKTDAEFTEEDKSQNEPLSKDQEAGGFAANTRLLEEKRLIYEKAWLEQKKYAQSVEAKRLEAEKAKEDTLPVPLLVQEPIQKVEPKIEQSSGNYVIQVAVVLDELSAQSIVDSLKQKDFSAYYAKVSNPGKLSGVYYRVRIGYFKDFSEAENFAKTRLDKSYKDWWIANETP